MSKEKDSILLSPKHGVNPSVTRCICCGKDYGVALLGKLKNDEEAPREIFHGLCNECNSVIESGGVMIIEIKDGEEGKKNPYYSIMPFAPINNSHISAIYGDYVLSYNAGSSSISAS
ncbi:MAG: hypothetical protein II110_02735, partial [Treponema sp.]|nr:hypothetical protein [Treponema sp.]